MKMKKLIASALALSMAAGLAGCGSAASSGSAASAAPAASAAAAGASPGMRSPSIKSWSSGARTGILPDLPRGGSQHEPGEAHGAHRLLPPHRDLYALRQIPGGKLSVPRYITAV